MLQYVIPAKSAYGGREPGSRKSLNILNLHFIVIRSLTPSTRRTTETRLAAALSGNIRAKREGERRILAKLSEQVGRRKKLQVESRFSRPQTEGKVLAAVDFMSQNTGTLEGDYLPR